MAKRCFLFRCFVACLACFGWLGGVCLFVCLCVCVFLWFCGLCFGCLGKLQKCVKMFIFPSFWVFLGGWFIIVALGFGPKAPPHLTLPCFSCFSFFLFRFCCCCYCCFRFGLCSFCCWSVAGVFSIVLMGWYCLLLLCFVFADVCLCLECVCFVCCWSVGLLLFCVYLVVSCWSSLGVVLCVVLGVV